MAKKDKVLNEGILDKMFSLFLKAKSQGKESKWISRMREKDPALGDVWAQWDKDSDDALEAAKRNFILAGKPEKAKEIDAMINKFKNM